MPPKAKQLELPFAEDRAMEPGPDKLSADVGLRPGTIRERVRIPSELEAAICQAYMENPIPSRKMSVVFGVSPSCISQTLRRNKILLKKKCRRSFSDEVSRVIQDRYEEGETIESLATEFKVTWQEIHAMLLSRGVQIRTRSEARRQCTLREDAFDEINEDSAYWVGYLMADGCITRGREGPYGISSGVKLSTKTADEDHLRRFLAFLDSTHGIHHCCSSGYRSKSGEQFPQSVTHVVSNHLVESLARFGVIPAKTHIAEVRLLEMNRDFWRGVIDGDGCIHIRKDGAPLLSLTGSNILLNQFRDFVRENAPDCNATVVHNKRHADTIGMFSFARASAARVLNVLYRDCKTALARKKALADSIIDNPEMFRDKRRGDKLGTRPDLTLAVLEEQFTRLGTWVAVAKLNGMHRSNLGAFMKKLKARTNG